MEINRFEDVIGVVTTQAITEGRFVVMTTHTVTNDFGSMADLPGCRVPATAEEAKRAKFILTWAVDNQETPIVVGVPQTTFALRGGFGAATNAPFAATVYLTHRGNQESLTIPSGIAALAYTEGTFTLPSGQYVYDTNIIKPGAAIIIQDATTDATAGEAGKPKYTATMAAGVIGFTERYDATTGKLTIRVE